MFINITDSKEANNKGSSGGLVHYLEKENRLVPRQKVEHWFNGEQSEIRPYEVVSKIDDNIAKLGKGMPNSFWSISAPARKRSRS